MIESCKLFFRFFVLSFLLVLYVPSIILGSEILAGPKVPYDEQKRGALVAYGGLEIYPENIRNASVSSCVSLGDSCVNRADAILKNADQFACVFMYRFNSPVLIKTLEEKHFRGVPVVVFMDYFQTYESSSDGSKYPAYVQRLIESVPTSLVKLGSKSFHQKVIISKKENEEAYVILGSANATYEADNQHSEDIVIIQNNLLASILLKEFQKLFTMEPKGEKALLLPQTVQIFHESRLKASKSNIDYLNIFAGKLQDNPLPANKSRGDVVALGMSTGFPAKEGTKKCLNVLSKALEHQENDFLLLFENFISLDETPAMKTIEQALTNPTRKLIIVDNNEHNGKTEKLLKSQGNNTVCLFKPFSGGKFHHKLVIQYVKEQAPIIYTGSFHISANSVTNNSENIIGIKSEHLADEYLSSLLLNSGLGEEQAALSFLIKQPTLHRKLAETKRRKNEGGQHGPAFSKTLFFEALERLQKKCHNKMHTYLDRFERIRDVLVSVANNGDEQNIIAKLFDNISTEWKEFNEDTIQRSIFEVKKSVFEGDIRPFYINKLKEEWDKIHSKDEDINDLPNYVEGKHESWLKEMNEWIKHIEHIKQLGIIDGNIREEVLFIENVYIALNDLNNYEAAFDKLVELNSIFKKVI